MRHASLYTDGRNEHETPKQLERALADGHELIAVVGAEVDLRVVRAAETVNVGRAGTAGRCVGIADRIGEHLLHDAASAALAHGEALIRDR